MQVPELIAGLEREGELLVAAAARTDLVTPIPTCPGWTMRDLVRHTGGVHRWATAHVVGRLLQPVDGLDPVVPVQPEDDVLIEWFVAGHAVLVQALRDADPDLACWTFLPAPSPLAFWARRQAHETGIHRVDAEGPTASITPFPPAFAADGIRVRDLHPHVQPPSCALPRQLNGTGMRVPGPAHGVPSPAATPESGFPAARAMSPAVPAAYPPRRW